MRMVLLQSIDSHWREHLAALDYLRQGIHLRGYAQKNPKQEYKREAFELFSQMLDVVKMDVTRVLMTVRIQTQEEAAQAAEALRPVAGEFAFAVFALAFLVLGLTRIDNGAKGAGLAFRLLILPGLIALWPLMLIRWISGGQPHG